MGRGPHDISRRSTHPAPYLSSFALENLGETMLLALLPLLGGAAAQFASLSSLIQGSSQGSVSTATPTTSQAAETPATSQVTPVTSQAATPVTSQAATPVTSQLGGAAGGTQSAPQSSLLSNSAGSSSSSATQASTAVPSSSQAPDTPVPGQDTLPPVQCELASRWRFEGGEVGG